MNDIRALLALAVCGPLAILATIIGLGVYRSELLTAVVVGGGLVIVALGMVALCLALWAHAHTRRREDAEYRLVMARTLAALARTGEPEARPMLPDLGEVIDLLDGGPRGDGVFGWRALPGDVRRLERPE